MHWICNQYGQRDLYTVCTHAVSISAYQVKPPIEYRATRRRRDKQVLIDVFTLDQQKSQRPTWPLVSGKEKLVPKLFLCRLNGLVKKNAPGRTIKFFFLQQHQVTICISPSSFSPVIGWQSCTIIIWTVSFSLLTILRQDQKIALEKFDCGDWCRYCLNLHLATCTMYTQVAINCNAWQTKQMPAFAYKICSAISICIHSISKYSKTKKMSKRTKQTSQGMMFIEDWHKTWVIFPPFPPSPLPLYHFFSTFEYG